MGIWERMSDSFREKLGCEFQFAPPQKRGCDTVETIKQMHDGRIRAFFGMGGIFWSASPDTEYTARALQNCRLTAHVSTKLNRSHLITGEVALILPCLGRSEIDRQESGEQFVTIEDSMGIINPSRGLPKPASKHLRSEPWIIAGLAKATLGRPHHRRLGSFDRGLRSHSRSHRACYSRVRKFQSSEFASMSSICRMPHVTNANSRTRKAKRNSSSSDLPRHELGPGQYLMTTVRSHDQFNTTFTA